MVFCVNTRTAGALLTGLFSSLAMTSGALADGMPSGPAAPAVVQSGYIWDGLYVAAGVGVGRFDHHVSTNASGPPPPPPCLEKCDTEISALSLPLIGSGHWNSTDSSWEGFGTLQAGYDRLIHERILIGAFADIDFYPDASHSFGNHHGGPDMMSLIAFPSGPQIDGHVDLKHVWSVGGRLGFLVTPCLLLYGAGGYTEASFDGAINVSMGGPVFGLKPPGPPPSQSLALSDELHGWFAGAGGEVKLDEHLSLKLEYRYSKFKGEAVALNDYHGGPALTAMPISNTKADFDADIHSVRAALVFKLGDPERHETVPLK